MKRGCKLLGVLVAALFAAAAVMMLVQQNREMEHSVYFQYAPEFGSLNGSDNLTTVPLQTFDEYESTYSPIKSNYFFQQLNQAEQQIYHAFLYACEQGFNVLSFPDRIADAFDIKKIFHFVQCDYPWMEMNTALTLYTQTMTSLGVLQQPVQTIQISGQLQEEVERKKQAIERAEQMVDSSPEDITSERDKARWLYQGLIQYTAYTEQIDYISSAPGYLYDALITGSTNCDGFAKGLAVLFNLAGLDCVCVYHNGDGPDEEGHTWNIAEIEGQYYHFDPTFDSAMVQYTQSDETFPYFQFSDLLLEKPIDAELALYAPACNNSDYDDAEQIVLPDALSENKIRERVSREISQAFRRGRSFVALSSPGFLAMSGDEQVAWLETMMKNSGQRYQVLTSDQSRTIMIGK